MVGSISTQLHAGGGKAGDRPPKLAFFVPDVTAARAALVKRGAKIGTVVSSKHFDMCNGADPDGNPFQLSSRP
jgi:hypothetical protein